MNRYTKMFMEKDGKKQVKLIQNFFIKPASGSISLNKVKCYNNKNM